MNQGKQQALNRFQLRCCMLHLLDNDIISSLLIN